MDKSKLIELTADIVSAQVSNNLTHTNDLLALIKSVFDAFSKAAAPAELEKVEPAVPVRSSVKHDYIICLEDGAKLKMLKRYLRSRFDMSPEEYCTKWNLPRDYPMVSPASAAARRARTNTPKKNGRTGIAQTAQPHKTFVKHPPRKATVVVHAGIVKPIAKVADTGRKKLGIFAAKAAAVAHLEGEKPASKPEQTKIRPARKARSKKSTTPML
jgi:predicted transcriptional regulator